MDRIYFFWSVKREMRSMRSQLGAVDEVSEQDYLTPVISGLDYIKLDDEAVKRCSRAVRYSSRRQDSASSDASAGNPSITILSMMWIGNPP